MPVNAVTSFGFQVSATLRKAAKVTECDHEAQEENITTGHLACSFSVSTASIESLAGVRCFEPGKQLEAWMGSVSNMLFIVFRPLSGWTYTNYNW